MVVIKQILNGNQRYDFPKIMESDYYRVIAYFSEPGKCLVLKAYAAARVSEGKFVDEFDMDHFQDYHGVIELFNSNGGKL
jgi:hypothetical protein